MNKIKRFRYKKLKKNVKKRIKNVCVKKKYIYITQQYSSKSNILFCKKLNIMHFITLENNKNICYSSLIKLIFLIRETLEISKMHHIFVVVLMFDDITCFVIYIYIYLHNHMQNVIYNINIHKFISTFHHYHYYFSLLLYFYLL